MTESGLNSARRTTRVISSIVLLTLFWFLFAIGVYWTFGWAGTEKFLTSLAMPLSLTWNIVLLGMIVSFRNGFARMGCYLAILAVWVWLVGNANIAGWLMHKYESVFPAKSPVEVEDDFDAILVLGGSSRRLASGRAEVTREGQRIVTAAELCFAGKTNWVITTRSHAELEEQFENGLTKDVLINLGIDLEMIVTLMADNTSQELRQLKAFVEANPDKFPNQRIGLVTSAFHMPRAMRLAEDEGLRLTPLPSGHRGTVRAWFSTDFLPVSRALEDNSILLKECLAFIVGR